MKTLNQFVEEIVSLYLKESAKIIKFNNKNEEPPKINHPDEINDGIYGADEAQRQLKNFHREIYRDDWAKTNFEGPEPKQDKAKRDEFYKKHNLEKPRLDDPINRTLVTARYLDHMHHHFPDIAERLNMKPFVKGGNEIEYKKDEERLAKHKNRFYQKSAVPYVTPLRNIKKTLSSWGAGVIHDVVNNFHKRNPELHGQPDHVAYKAHKQEREGKIQRPLKFNEFSKHWNDINGINKTVVGLKKPIKENVTQKLDNKNNYF